MKRSTKHKLVMLFSMGVGITFFSYYGLVGSSYGFGYLWGALFWFFIERLIGEYE